MDLTHYLARSEGTAGSKGEQNLLARLEEVVHLLEVVEPDDRARIRHALDIITSGQELDLRRFELGRAGQGMLVREDRPGATEAVPAGLALLRSVGALETEDELDDYTYRVAGCVGEFVGDQRAVSSFSSEARRGVV